MWKWLGVSKKKVIYQGAEAELIIINYKKKEVIQKKRLRKSYRIEYIDNLLISSRTKEEAKLINEARQAGVTVPIIYDIDLNEGTILMQYIKGERIKDIFNKIKKTKRIEICKKIGRNIALLHNHNIIHGDLTTSNMIYNNDKIYFIDFGLGEKNHEIESKGVDLHVLMEAIESTHPKYSDFFKIIIDEYSKNLKKDSEKVKRKIQEIIRRGRYRWKKYIL